MKNTFIEYLTKIPLFLLAGTALVSEQGGDV